MTLNKQITNKEIDSNLNIRKYVSDGFVLILVLGGDGFLGQWRQRRNCHRVSRALNKTNQ